MLGADFAHSIVAQVQHSECLLIWCCMNEENVILTELVFSASARCWAATASISLNDSVSDVSVYV